MHKKKEEKLSALENRNVQIKQDEIVINSEKRQLSLETEDKSLNENKKGISEKIYSSDNQKKNETLNQPENAMTTLEVNQKITNPIIEEKLNQEIIGAQSLSAFLKSVQEWKLAGDQKKLVFLNRKKF